MVLWSLSAALLVLALWPRDSGPSEGASAPQFQVPLLSEQGSFSFSGKRERPLLIEAFASWCSACRRNSGLLNSFESSSYAQKIDTLAISVEESASNARRAMRDWPIHGKVAHDNLKQFSRKFSISVLPTYILIDRDGRVADVAVGGVTSRQLREWTELSETAQSKSD
ncbi:MAG: TlpA family protein disulfide reductase [Polyangiaceae bacterium]|nr:TlpA family protein disulfide reductase [Polyangiaceae bacterium]